MEKKNASVFTVALGTILTGGGAVLIVGMLCVLVQQASWTDDQNVLKNPKSNPRTKLTAHH